MPMPLDPGARGLSSLQQTQQIAADTEALGLGILDQLGHQRNQLTSAVQTREEAHRTLSTSNRLIRQMHRRATWMKCALCSIVMLLVGGIGVIVYMHWFAGGDPPAPAPPAGRMLQGEVPSPPPAIVATPQPGVGAGIILLLCVGLFGVLLTFLAIPRGIVARTGAFCVSFFLFLIFLIMLFEISEGIIIEIVLFAFFGLLLGIEVAKSGIVMFISRLDACFLLRYLFFLQLLRYAFDGVLNCSHFQSFTLTFDMQHFKLRSLGFSFVLAVYLVIESFNFLCRLCGGVGCLLLRCSIWREYHLDVVNRVFVYKIFQLFVVRGGAGHEGVLAALGLLADGEGVALVHEIL